MCVWGWGDGVEDALRRGRDSGTCACFPISFLKRESEEDAGVRGGEVCPEGPLQMSTCGGAPDGELQEGGAGERCNGRPSICVCVGGGVQLHIPSPGNEGLDVHLTEQKHWSYSEKEHHLQEGWEPREGQEEPVPYTLESNGQWNGVGPCRDTKSSKLRVSVKEANMSGFRGEL